jgi:formylglycine-generating enzyme required for sulfatase activity
VKPKDVFRECEKCPEMVVVPAGAFTGGSPAGEKGRIGDAEGPQHIVTIGKPFAVGKLHVTVDQFAVFVEDSRYESHSECAWRSPGFAQEGSHPVVCVTFEDANAYVNWLANRTHKPYRLPSEAEWEYAARGQTSPDAYPRFWFGDNERELCRYGNGWDQAVGSGGAPCNDGYHYTSPAGHYQPNAFGLYDMFGNAWQWIADCWHDSHRGARADGSAWTFGICNSGHVIRGGSWGSFPRDLRAAVRIRGATSYDAGFRVARTLGP